MAKTNQTALESRIHEIVSSAAAAIAAAVQGDFAAELQQVLDGGHSPSNGLSAQAPRTRGPAKAARKQPAQKAEKAEKATEKAADKASRKAPAKFVRRSPEEITAENNKLLAFIRSNPGLRSEDILKALGLPKPNVASGLQRLRDEGKVRMVGVKRAATYTVA